MPNDNSERMPMQSDPAQGELSDDQLDSVLGGVDILDVVAAVPGIAYNLAKAKISEIVDVVGGGS